MSESIEMPTWVSEFEQNGLVVVPDAIDDAVIQPVIDEISAWVDRRALALYERREITNLYPTEPFQTRYGLLYNQSKKMQNGLDLMYSRGPAMFSLLHSPEIEPVSLPCKKGDLVLMSRFTPHCSTPNRSNDCRWSLDCRFQTTDQHTGRTAHPVFSVRGSPTDGFPNMDYAAWCAAWVDAFENPRGESGHRFE